MPTTRLVRLDWSGNRGSLVFPLDRATIASILAIMMKAHAGGGTAAAPKGRRPVRLPTIVARWQRHEVEVYKRSALEAKKGAASVLRVAADQGWRTTADVTRPDVVKWLRRFIEEGSGGAAKTARNHLARLRAFVAYAAETELLDGALLDNVRLPAAPRRKGAAAFTWQEVSALITRAEHQEATSGRAGKYGPMRSSFYAFLALTGLRFQEAKLQRWDDINLERRTLTVTADKARRNDPVRFNRECQALLRTWRKWSRGDTVFSTTPSHHTLVADMEACGIPSSAEGKKGQWHRFRKALCTQLAVQQVDPEGRRRMMRHKDAAITQDIYTDAEIVENSTLGAAILENLPRLNGFLGNRLTRGELLPDTPTAKTEPNNQVNEKRLAFRLPRSSQNRGGVERASSRARCTPEGGHGSMEPGGIEPPATARATLAACLDAQIQALQLIRSALGAEAADGWNKRHEDEG